jgi:hypothetical protein
MALIQLETQVYAPVAVCFDLSRDIDLHVESMTHMLEKAIGGTTSGLIGLHETVESCYSAKAEAVNKMNGR